LRKPWLIVFLAASALALAAVFLLPSGAANETVRYKDSFFDVFDTYSEITVYAASEADGKAAVDKAHTELLAYHQLYDIYNDYPGLNNLKTVNDNAGLSPVTADARLTGLLTFAKEMDVRTGGRMNVAMGSVLSIWHDHREAGIADPENATLPTLAELQAAAEHTDISLVEIDTEAGTVYLADPLMRLDVGAVAKGYAVEQVARQMIADGITSALLNIGGNVRAIGRRGDGVAWQVNIQNPDLSAANQSLTSLNIADLSLVTSGSYQRYYTVDGKQYNHIINPDTLYPADTLWGVSIVTQDSGLADALSTALFTLSADQGQTLLRNFPGVEALWVEPDGSVIRSDGFSALAGEQAQ